MNVNGLCSIFVVAMLAEVFVWAQDPCTPWIYRLESKKCYRKYCDKRKAEDAQKVCQLQGGNLVTICDEAENDFVSMMGEVVTSYPVEKHDRTWIGYRRSSEQWQWISGSSCSYTSWFTIKSPIREKGVHAYLMTSWGYRKSWDAHTTSWELHYICERSFCPQEDVE